jgi:hypothetical protein
MDTSFDDIYLIFAMGRTGHHAIIEWIARQYPGQVTQLHNCRKRDYLKQGKLKPRIGKTSSWTNKGDKKAMIYNFEEFDIDLVDEYNILDFDQVKKAKRVHTMLVLRDPYNWIASSLKIGGGFTNDIVDRVTLYKKYLKSAVDEINYSWNPIPFNYNKWFKSSNYRKKMAKRLCIREGDSGLNFVPPNGGGSSFDKQSFKERAQQMNVLERWKQYKNNPKFKQVLDEEIVDLSNQIFGEIT